MIFTQQEIMEMPTIHSGQFADLKWENKAGTLRIWHSRMGIEDGELDPFQVEQLIDGRWVDVTTGPYAKYLVQGQGIRHAVNTPSGRWERND